MVYCRTAAFLSPKAYWVTPEVELGLGVVGIGRRGLLKGRHGFSVAPLLPQGHPQVVEGFVALGIEGNGLPEQVRGPVGVALAQGIQALLAVNVAQALPGLGKSRVQGQGLLKTLDGLVLAALPLEGQTQPK
jgi:hypothetical protein